MKSSTFGLGFSELSFVLIQQRFFGNRNNKMLINFMFMQVYNPHFP